MVQRTFGKSSSDETPSFSHRPRPHSHGFVVPSSTSWYAQSHPDEDFAETLPCGSRRGSTGVPATKIGKALQKLEYVDELMRSLAGPTAVAAMPEYRVTDYTTV